MNPEPKQSQDTKNLVKEIMALSKLTAQVSQGHSDDQPSKPRYEKTIIIVYTNVIVVMQYN